MRIETARDVDNLAVVVRPVLDRVTAWTHATRTGRFPGVSPIVGVTDAASTLAARAGAMASAAAITTLAASAGDTSAAARTRIRITALPTDRPATARHWSNEGTLSVLTSQGGVSARDAITQNQTGSAPLMRSTISRSRPSASASSSRLRTSARSRSSRPIARASSISAS